MSTLVVYLTNGRKACLLESMETLPGHLTLPADPHLLIVDDSGDPEYRKFLRDRFGEVWEISEVGGAAQGYSAAVQHIWRKAEAYDFVFLIEDDFLFERPVNLQDLATSLRHCPEVAQFVLLRQSWFGNEVEAGGLLPALERMGHKLTHVGTNWIEHRATWSTNPTLFRGGNWVKNHPWPSGEGSEYRFGQSLFLTEPKTVCAYWGDGTEYVRHIGERKGFGY